MGNRFRSAARLMFQLPIWATHYRVPLIAGFCPHVLATKVGNCAIKVLVLELHWTNTCSPTERAVSSARLLVT